MSKKPPFKLDSGLNLLYHHVKIGEVCVIDGNPVVRIESLIHIDLKDLEDKIGNKFHLDMLNLPEEKSDE